MSRRVGRVIKEITVTRVVMQVYCNIELLYYGYYTTIHLFTNTYRTVADRLAHVQRSFSRRIIFSQTFGRSKGKGNE